MKKILAGVVIPALMCAALPASAAGSFGVGAIVGEPTGISIKKWLDDTHAVDFAAAWSFSDNDSFQFHADYLVHDFSVLKPEGLRGRLPVYVGIGMRIKLKEDDNNNGHNNNDNIIGIRVPIGVTYMFATSPIDLFAEIVPILDVAPDSEFDINAAIGARFYF